MRKFPSTCPSCAEQMMVTELTCPKCDTQVRGRFPTPGLQRLNDEQLYFVEVFLRCRGSIKEVERDLKISYPTVRAKLDQVIEKMGFPITPSVDDEPVQPAHNVLNELDNGSITFDEAIRILKEGAKNE